MKKYAYLLLLIIHNVFCYSQPIPSASVNILDYGADPTGKADCSSAIRLAMQALTPARVNWGIAAYGQGTVIFPRGIYRVDSTINVRTTITLQGDGAGEFPYQEVQLRFKGNTRGIDIRASNNGFGGRMVVLRNLCLVNLNAATDSTADGVFSNTRCRLDNIAVYSFGGNGFSFVTNDSGNANNSSLTNCTAYYNAKNGLFLSGNECNNFGIYGGNYQVNGMCGILDNSFIGNNYYDVHTSSNGLRDASTYNKAWCKYNGKIYQAIKYPNQKGIEPTVNANWTQYWVENNALTLASVATWSADSTYWITGSYVVTGAAATSHFFGCYSEGGQGKNQFNQFTIAWGGNMGAGFTRKQAMWIYGSASGIILQAARVRLYDRDSTSTYAALDEVGGLMVGSDKVATPAHGGGQFKYDEASRTTSLFSGNTKNFLAFTQINQGYNPSGLGVSSLARYGQIIFPYPSGFYMGDVNNGSQSRNILATRSGAPTTGSHAIGDFCLYIGSDTLTVGYKCTVAGTPGTWVRIKSGN